MNSAYFDSSAFAKLFVFEPGSESLVSRYESMDSDMRAISTLAALEVRSAIRRRELIGDLTKAHADSAAAALSAEVARLRILPFSPQVSEQASKLIDRHVLRALDAVQLATAVMFRLSVAPHDQLLFVSSDDKLLMAAVAEGFEIWQPQP